MRRALSSPLVAVLVLVLGGSACSSSKSNLSVPSPDWRDQVIYFAVTDRFANGVTTNDNQGGGEFDPTNKDMYSGGDLAGLRGKLDYIQQLGATAVWITPQVANQWYDPQVNVAGYHGYWARAFDAVDEHLGTKADYEGLASDLHKRGMYLVQDIVANHMGNFFDYDASLYNADDPTSGYSQNTASTPSDHPTQAPFDENDPRRAKDLTDGIFHWTPPIVDYSDPVQVLTYQLSNLDDLATEKPAVRTALKQSFGDWIRSGADAFRIDTVLYVEHDFWHDFVHDPAAGLLATAAATGRDDFLTFGEAFVTSAPLDDAGDVQARSYLGTDNVPELGGVLNFPLYITLREVFGEGRPTHDLTYRLERQKALYPDVNRLPNFIENHDVGRFLLRSTAGKTREALLLLLSLPGIPILYYGAEQDFTETRASMFAGGYGSGGTDHFKTTGATYTFVKQAIAMRKANPVFSRGNLTVLADSTTGPGLFAFRRDYQGVHAFGLFNSSERTVLIADLDLALPSGTKLQVLAASGMTSPPATITVDAAGKLTRSLPPQAALVLLATSETVTVTPPTVTLAVTNPTSGATVTDTLVATGTVAGAGGTLALVLDGYLDTGIDVPRVTGDDTLWTATIPDYVLGNGQNTHTLGVYSLVGGGIASPMVTFESNISLPVSTASVVDPEGDDHGPAGYSYTLPNNSTFQGQLDITGVTATATGNALAVAISMKEVTKVWSPQYGFDHVCFSVFIELPGVAGGQTLLPKLNASTPAGMTWNRVEFADGWHSTLYGTTNATASSYGDPVLPAPSISVSGNTVTFSFSPAALGNLPSLSGAKVYVTTWDFDGVQNVLRPLTPTAGVWSFGGGDGAVDPLIFDDSEVVVQP